MRLTILLLTVAVLHVSAKSDAQKVSVTLRNGTLQEAFAQIKEQTGYSFFWKNDLLDKAPRITVSIKSAEVTKALNECLNGLPFGYEINGNIIYIQPKDTRATPATFFTPPPAVHDLRVHITDSAGSPLQGASVVVKGTKQGGQTDADGNVILAGLNGDETLVISYVGYDIKEVPVGEDAVLKIELKRSISQLEDMVLKGYYSTTRALNTGNASVVTSEVIGRQPVGDPLAALEGRVPGLQITQITGIPGSAFSVRLRGQNSIANGNDPLYVVDGISFNSSFIASKFEGGQAAVLSPFNYLNPNDIENVTVLKDADATAIYGSRGANGVILITTKKGNVGKSSVNFNIYSGFGRVGRKLNLLNTKQYLEMRHEAFTNDNAEPGPTDYDINGVWDTTRYTDWQKIFIGNTSHTTDVQGSILGGNEQMKYIISGNYRHETTVFPSDFFDRKVSFHTAFSYSSVNKKFHADLSTSYIYDYSRLPSSDQTNGNIFLAPDAPSIYDNNGNVNWENSTWYNPFASLDVKSNIITNNLLSNLILSYRLLPGLELKSNFGYNNIGLEHNEISPGSVINPKYVTPSSRTHYYGTNKIQSWIIEPQITYTKKLKKGTLDLLFGTTFQQSQNNLITEIASGFSNDDQIENMAAATSLYMTGYDDVLYSYNAWYGRIGYNLDEKYLVNITGRRDGSSRFGPGKQFGNFGAIGAAWIFSKENFIKSNLSFLSFGKLRASYGSTGNDQLGDYKYLSTYSPYRYSYQGVTSLYPTQLTNPFFGWERVNKLETGMELGFFDNRIMLNASWYRNRTGSQLVGYALPTITGFSSIQANLPAVIQNTGLELELNTSNFQNRNFKWTSSVNISFPQNKLISYPNLAGSSYAARYAIGQPLFIQFVYHYTGMDEQTGQYKFADLDNSNTISYPKDLEPVFVGVKFSGGLENNIVYKNWEFNFFLHFVKQNGLEFLSYVIPGVQGFNQPSGVMDRWRKPGDKTIISPYTQDYGSTISQLIYSYFNYSDGVIGDASFVRLKNISLSWQIPDKWKNTMHIQTASLYIQCQNLLTFTKYKGLDPEYPGSATRLPLIRIMTAGVKITL